MLYCGKVIDLVFQRHNNHAARVLAGGPFDAGTGQGQPFLFGVARLDSALFQVFQHIAVRGLVRQTGDGTRTEHVIVSEQFFHIVVRPVLIFAREVQVDIRHLVSLET